MGEAKGRSGGRAVLALEARKLPNPGSLLRRGPSLALLQPALKRLRRRAGWEEVLRLLQTWTLSKYQRAYPQSQCSPSIGPSSRNHAQVCTRANATYTQNVTGKLASLKLGHFRIASPTQETRATGLSSGLASPASFWWRP